MHAAQAQIWANRRCILPPWNIPTMPRFIFSSGSSPPKKPTDSIPWKQVREKGVLKDIFGEINPLTTTIKMSKENCLCHQCNISKDCVSCRENGLAMCDICDEKRLRALRLERRQKLNDSEHAVSEDMNEGNEAPVGVKDPAADHETGKRTLHTASTAGGGSSAEVASDASDDHHCTAQCPYREDAVNLEMVRCCLCSKWYHLVCVSLPPEEMGVWPCPECRNLVRDVKQTKSVLNKLMEHMNTVMATLNNQTEVLNLEKSQLQNKLSQLENENEILRVRNAELEHQLQNNAPATNAACINSTTLVVGSSLICNIDEHKLKDTEVRCMSGAKFRDIAA